jgi:putative hemolysin
MINIKEEMIKKFPKLSDRSPLIQKSLFKIAQKLIHEDKINNFLDEFGHLEGFAFIEAVLEYFQLDFSYSNNEMENIPSAGRVVIVANHPLGALDALVLLTLISKVRKDVKIIANDFLAGITQLEPLLLKIDNFQAKQAKESIQRVYDSLNNEEAVIIFPAGEVSRISPTGVKDGEWQKGFINFAKKTKSPILPILVDAKNSKTFYTMSVLNKTFSTLLLSDEMFKKQDKTLKIKVGKIIPNDKIFPKNVDKKILPKLYKKHLYALKKGKKLFLETENQIALAQNVKEIKKELKDSQLLGETSDGKKIYLFDFKADSSVIQEIGRLRELSFRKVNEGVNKRRDIDKYDKYYKHIILWDEDELEIVGSYRIAIGEDIYESRGFEGFYTNTLFTFEKNFRDKLLQSIELGRSFVQPKYWGSRALDYLWYGIGAFLRENPEIKYMYGPVSLSASYPQLAKELIVDFYSNYFPAKKQLVKATNPFEFETAQIALENSFSYDDYKSDFKLLKNQLKAMNVVVPTLYKQYSELCEDGGVQFQGFNVDPDFSDCIDGFIMVDISKIKKTKIDRYIDNQCN